MGPTSRELLPQNEQVVTRRPRNPPSPLPVVLSSPSPGPRPPRPPFLLFAILQGLYKNLFWSIVSTDTCTGADSIRYAPSGKGSSRCQCIVSAIFHRACAPRGSQGNGRASKSYHSLSAGGIPRPKRVIVQVFSGSNRLWMARIRFPAEPEYQACPITPGPNRPPDRRHAAR